jgi:hypothetical protein
MYLDSFDANEFALFHKFNNAHERGTRHIDVYFIDSAEEEEKIRYNKEKLTQDTCLQLKRLDFQESLGDDKIKITC